MIYFYFVCTSVLPARVFVHARVSDPLELGGGGGAVIDRYDHLLGIESRSSGRVASAINHYQSLRPRENYFLKIALYK